MNKAIIEMRGINKSFHGLKALDCVDFTLLRGEIHSLLGENGAGKTTLMNILYGLYTKDSGTVYYNDRKVNFTKPLDAIEHGIGMIHQHFMLEEPMTVYENIVLGREESRFGFLKESKSKQIIQDIMDQSGLYVNLDAKVYSLPIGLKQRVEILKALFRNVNVLIMDEPTAVLTPQETDELFVTVRKLKENGTSIILITHKLRETYAVADHITVMRKGRVISTSKTSETSPQDLVQSMVGKNVSSDEYPHDQRIGEPVLTVESVCTKIPDTMNLKNLSLDVHKGEILGIAGVDGNGQSTLSDVLIGVVHPSSGRVHLYDQDITNNTPREQNLAGVAVIPEDRHAMGQIPTFSVVENVILGIHRRPKYQKMGLIRTKEAERIAAEAVKKYDIHPAQTDLSVKDFSGGNQQKIIVARELENESVQLIIASQPTRGLDIGATCFVHQQLIRMRDEGKAILLISTELDEIRCLSDRIAVMFEGQILDIRKTKDYTIEQLGLLMAGQREGGRRD